jgi:eukaryotic-like serine/threonine-protein kinase
LEGDEIGAGDTLGRYELLVPIAQGGTATVWAARSHDDPAGRTVAVKMMLADVLDDENEADSQAMLLDEARTVSRIRHPNVAEMRDVGEADGVVFLVMEWVDGEPLHVVSREAAKQGPMPIRVAVGIAKQVAAGLHAAHELADDEGHALEIVHRDVSPQNLILGFDGLVKIVDFGVAKATSNLNRTTVGQIKGKAGFMAPEQARGAPVDRRTDVFALGVVLYQLVAGKHPFRGDNEFATMLRIADPRPADALGGVRPDCPAELEVAVARALEKLKDHRFETMKAFEEALARAVPDAASAGELRTFVTMLVGPRGEKRRQAIREAAALADRKNPGQRAHVDKERVSRASERPAPVEDSEVHDRAELPRNTPAGASAEATPFPAPPPSSAHYLYDDDISPVDVARFKNRRAPVIAMLVIAGLLALVYFALRD